jgi:sugar/nucleoside kinase (ribokinase family)
LSSPDLDLLVVGDCNPDLLVTGQDVLPAFGQAEKLVDSMSLMIGGSAAITAVAAARLGLRVALVAAVGDDPAGELMLGLLGRESVDTSRVIVRAGAATGFTTVLSGGSDRAILTALGAMTSLTTADVHLVAARHLHVSSYFLLEEVLAAGLSDLLHAARAQGMTTSLDTNYDPRGRWGDERLRAVLRETEVFLPNEAEALAISGEPDVDAAARSLTGLAASVVVKLGERGALCAAAGAEPALVSVPPVPPVDTTGAGDCFNAA